MKRIFQSMVIIGSMVVNLAFSADLINVYEDAMRNAPPIQSAEALRQAAEEDFHVAGSAFLPRLDFQGLISENKLADHHPRYRSSQFSFTLTQTLFNRKAWYQAKTKGLGALAARYNYQEALQEFIYQIAVDYCNVLSAKQNQKVAAARYAEYKNLYDQIFHRVTVGKSSPVDLSKAQASMDEAYATEVVANHKVAISYERLAALTGREYGQFAAFSKNYFVIVPEPQDLTSWKAKAFADHNAVREKILLRDIQKESINIERSSYIPAVSLVAATSSYNQNLYGSDAPNGHLTDKMVGLQFSWTLFEGGSYSAQVARERDLLTYRDLDLNLKKRQIAESIQADWLQLHSALNEQQAHAKALTASELALKSYQAQFETGTVTMTEVLEKIKAYYEAESHYYEAQYTAILAWLAFKKDVGILSQEALQELNKQLEPMSQEKNSSD